MVLRPTSGLIPGKAAPVSGVRPNRKPGRRPGTVRRNPGRGWRNRRCWRRARAPDNSSPRSANWRRHWWRARQPALLSGFASQRVVDRIQAPHSVTVFQGAGVPHVIGVISDQVMGADIAHIVHAEHRRLAVSVSGNRCSSAANAESGSSGASRPCWLFSVWPRKLGFGEPGSQSGVGRLKRSLQIRDLRWPRFRWAVRRGPQHSCGNVAGENDHAVAGARIIRLRVELRHSPGGSRDPPARCEKRCCRSTCRCRRGQRFVHSFPGPRPGRTAERNSGWAGAPGRRFRELLRSDSARWSLPEQGA